MNGRKVLGWIALLAAPILALFSNGAFAADGQNDIGLVANALTVELISVKQVIGFVCAVSGSYFAVKAALAFKEHAESNGRVKLTKPLLYSVASACLLGLPEVASAILESLSVEPTAAIQGMAGAAEQTSQPTIETIMKALVHSLPAVSGLIGWISIFCGLVFLVKAVYMLADAGSKGDEDHLWSIFTLALAGGMCLSILPMLDVFSASVGAAGSDAHNILADGLLPPSDNGFDVVVAACLKVVQVIGFIGFFRAILILADAGAKKSVQMGETRAAVVQMVAASLCINMSFTLQAIASTIGALPVLCAFSKILCAG